MPRRCDAPSFLPRVLFPKGKLLPHLLQWYSSFLAIHCIFEKLLAIFLSKLVDPFLHPFSSCKNQICIFNRSKLWKTDHQLCLNWQIWIFKAVKNIRLSTRIVLTIYVYSLVFYALSFPFQKIKNSCSTTQVTVILRNIFSCNIRCQMKRKHCESNFFSLKELTRRWNKDHESPFHCTTFCNHPGFSALQGILKKLW